MSQVWDDMFFPVTDGRKLPVLVVTSAYIDHTLGLLTLQQLTDAVGLTQQDIDDLNVIFDPIGTLYNTNRVAGETAYQAAARELRFVEWDKKNASGLRTEVNFIEQCVNIAAQYDEELPLGDVVQAEKDKKIGSDKDK